MPLCAPSVCAIERRRALRGFLPSDLQMPAADNLSSLASLALAGSLAMERFVTIVKTALPWLTEEKPTVLGDVTPRSDRRRRAIVQALALAGSVATSMLVGTGDVWYDKTIQLANGGGIPWWLYALMISGGSAVWTNVVQFASSAKDVQAQQKQAMQRDAKSVTPDVPPAAWVQRAAPATIRHL